MLQITRGFMGYAMEYKAFSRVRLGIFHVSTDDFVKDVRSCDVFVWKEFIEKHVDSLKVFRRYLMSYFACALRAEIIKSLAVVAGRVDLGCY
jgi:hypothetical protein